MLCIVAFYYPAFTGTHCTYSRRDGQAEWLVTYRDVLVVHRQLSTEY